jgi:hypothetical protein
MCILNLNLNNVDAIGFYWKIEYVFGICICWYNVQHGSCNNNGIMQG